MTRATTTPARATSALALGLALALAGCDDSSFSLRLVFPDAASRAAATRLQLVAVDPSAGLTCQLVVGRSPGQLGTAVLSSFEASLESGQAPGVLQDVPMRALLIAAAVHDARGLFLQACKPVTARPGDHVEVVLRLNCAPGRTPCLDLDGDGVPGDQDCDDEDPCRSPKLKEAANLCALPAASFPALPAACLAAHPGLAPPYCGDGIDQDCDGVDATCVADADCDGSSPPQDCDDKDPAVHPGAADACDGKDNNCNGVIDEGCSPCDLDGDGHASSSTTDPSCKLPKDDPDDYDAGIHPETTKDTGGAEGGTVAGALREYCSNDPSKDKNGLPPRQVDHDGDGKPAKDDGCPTTTCDQDGDGFMGAQCSPPKALEDCDDADPKTFPGAPDRCGDGKAQNCVSDGACTCDKDGDGYCPPADCDDANPAIHPWAKELCNGLDDDCDGLTDEANPTAQGALLSTLSPLCNDSNVGACAPPCSPAGSQGCSAAGRTLSGVCACSRQIPGAKQGASRVQCPTESAASGAGVRCFGALQPASELCNNSDDNCDGSLTDDGKDQCSAPTATCCSTQPACRDLSSDKANCGACGKVCDPLLSDRCVAQECRCGSSPACTNGRVCSGASCICEGCVNGASCVSGNADTLCGKDGSTCSNCSMAGMTCFAQACSCSGCMSGATCYAGTSLGLCGKNGSACKTCSSANPCMTPLCTVSGSCSSSVVADGTGCTVAASTGKCNGGLCCVGCLEGGQCWASNDTTHCGKGGIACTACVNPQVCNASGVCE